MFATARAILFAGAMLASTVGCKSSKRNCEDCQNDGDCESGHCGLFHGGSRRCAYPGRGVETKCCDKIATNYYYCSFYYGDDSPAPADASPPVSIAQLSANPTIVSVGTVPLGTTSSSAYVRITNSGTVAGEVSTTVDNPAVSAPGCSGNLSPGDYCDLFIRWTPTALNDKPGEVSVGIVGGNTVVITVLGFALPAVQDGSASGGAGGFGGYAGTRPADASAAGGVTGSGGVVGADGPRSSGGVGGAPPPFGGGAAAGAGGIGDDGPAANGGLVARDAPVATGGTGASGTAGVSGTAGAVGTGGTTSTGGAASTRDAGKGDAAIPNEACIIDGSPAPAGTVCRVAAGLCDIAEVCDGVGVACPFDSYQAAGQVCRPRAGDCDHEETCTGTSAACPADTFLSKGAVCRSAVSVCDVADTCDGVDADCPPDVVAPATTPCRASTDGNICDPPEYCTAKSNQCPADAKYGPPAAAPGGVLVTPGDLLADVAWTAVTGATGYNVKSSITSGVGYSVRGSPTSSPFTVTPITAGPTYYFVVSAYFGQTSCESPNSSQVSALSCVATAPTALAATPDAAGHVALTWTPPSGSVASYSVSRSTTSGSEYAVLTSGLLTTSYTDSPVIPAGGTATFYYVVRANTGNCYSPYSAQATAVAVAATPP
jgi:hypothetical protein